MKKIYGLSECINKQIKHECTAILSSHNYQVADVFQS